jgi:hypothetical protein
MSRSIPIPTTSPTAGDTTSVCFNDEWAPYIWGALKYLARPEYWGRQDPDDLQQVLEWAEDLISTQDFDCSHAEGGSVFCNQDLTTDDGGWTIDSSYGTWGTGDGWTTVHVGATAYVFLGGPEWSSVVGVISLELDLDASNLQHFPGDDDVIAIFTRTPAGYSLIGSLQYLTEGFQTLFWSGLGSVDDLAINISGRQPGSVQITGMRIVTDADTGMDCNG